MVRRSAKKEGKQGAFEFPNGHGGRRKGAGRKPKGERAGVAHRRREAFAGRFPLHVTLRVRDGLPGLREARAYRVLRKCFAKGGDRFGFRLVEFAVLGNHVHMVCEAEGRGALSRGVAGLSIRIAKGLNRTWKRSGKVWADRYHDRVLRTPREVRNVLVYVLRNAARHGRRRIAIDRFSSGPWFGGWKLPAGFDVRPTVPSGLPCARTWLLARGWLRYGRIASHELPATQ